MTQKSIFAFFAFLLLTLNAFALDCKVYTMKSQAKDLSSRQIAAMLETGKKAPGVDQLQSGIAGEGFSVTPSGMLLMGCPRGFDVVDEKALSVAFLLHLESAWTLPAPATGVLCNYAGPGRGAYTACQFKD
jgi:hypothetical protein